MKNDALFTAQRTNRWNILNDTNFVVDEHDADHDGVRPDRSFQSFQIKQTVRLHVQVSHVKPLAFQLAAGIQHGFVFGLHRDDVLALAFVEMGCAFQGQIVRLRRAASPDNFSWIGTNQVSDLLTRFFNCCFGLPTPRMAAGSGVAEMLT